MVDATLRANAMISSGCTHILTLLVDGWVCGSLGMLIGPGRSAGRWSVNGYVVNGKGNACEIICVIEAHTLITPFVLAITSARRNHSLFCHIAMHCHDIHSGKPLRQL